MKASKWSWYIKEPKLAAFSNRAILLRSWSRPVWAPQQQVKYLVPSFTLLYKKFTFRTDWWTGTLPTGRIRLKIRQIYGIASHHELF